MSSEPNSGSLQMFEVDQASPGQLRRSNPYSTPDVVSSYIQQIF